MVEHRLASESSASSSATEESTKKLSADTTLAVAWALRLALEEILRSRENDPPPVRTSTRVMQQLLVAGDPLDLLRPRATAIPRCSHRKGLLVEPYFWELAIATVDIAHRADIGHER